MELVIKKPTYSNGVYIALQLIEKKAYIGESNDIFRRIGEHISCITGINNDGYGSNSNLIAETDKRIAIFAVHNNMNTYKKRGLNADIWTPWIYDETIYMFLMRKYGFELYNAENDNVGYERSFILTDVLISPIKDSENYNKQISLLKEKTIKYLLTLKLNRDNATEKQVIEDINEYESTLKNCLKNIYSKDFSDGVWHLSKQDLEHIWNNKVMEIEKQQNKIKTKDYLSLSYYLIKDLKQAKKYVYESTGSALSKDTIELCGIKSLSKAELAEMIRLKKMDTTIFAPFGAYLGQTAATILATKSEDLKKHKLVRNCDGECKITDRAPDDEKGFCEWSLKRLNEIDTRDFFETTNENNQEPKYIFLTYTSSKEQAGEINTPRLNPVDGESFFDFKKRMEENIEKEKKDRIAKKIQINWKGKKRNTVNIPETMFPEIISGGENRTLLIADLFALDGYVRDYSELYKNYWAHFASLSENGWEKPEITENYNYREGEDNYDKSEKIGDGVYRTYKEHKEIKPGQHQKCGRIRGVEEREALANIIESKEFYDESEDNKDYRNIIIAELTYPYIATIEE